MVRWTRWTVWMICAAVVISASGCAELSGLFEVPPMPTGPGTAVVGQEVTFDLPGVSALHQYKYDWGDGTKGEAGSGKQKHAWSAAGEYGVRAKNLCPFGHWASAWSEPAKIVVTPAEPAAVKRE